MSSTIEAESSAARTGGGGYDVVSAMSTTKNSKEASGTPAARKRLYEHGEWEEDREMDKMFRCNYWEDPAYADRLQRYGLHLARAAALYHFCERANRITDALLAHRREARAAAAGGRY